jgi:ABC-type sugar transport system ATPase subunit
VRLQASNIHKSFGATKALIDVSFTLQPGKVHALVGENGAGKSTLFKICAGALPLDHGEMSIGAKPYAPRSMQEAQKAGVALVFQEITINTSLDIAENIFIDRMQNYAGPLGITRWKKLRQEAQRILDSIEAGINVTAPLGSLDLGQLKVLEVARALSYDPQVLLLDESTAYLSTREIETLFRCVDTLKNQDIAVGYISHHLDEIEKLADEITILKDGNWVGNYDRGQLSNDEIETLMVGREIGKHIYPPTRQFTPEQQPILVLEEIVVPGQLRNVKLDLYKGEVLGIGGLKGAGGEAILSILNGDIAPTSGRVHLNRRGYKPRRPFDAWHEGIAYLPGDRTREGLIMEFPVRENLTMAAIPHKGPMIDRAAEKRVVADIIPRLMIKAESPNVPCTSLSGGNLQKVVLGKCIAAKPSILLLNNPTRGVDVGARMHIYDMIRRLAEQGVSVIMLSEDLPELIGNSDRIMILRKGKVSKTFDHDEFPSEEEIISHMI